MINKNSKNAEILSNEAILKMLNEGKVVVIDKGTTKNSQYELLFLMAYVEGINGGSKINDGQSFLLKFDRQPQRAVQNANVEMSDKIEIGQSLNDVFGKDFALEVQDTTSKSEDYDQSPRATRDGETLVSAETGKPVYRNVALTLKESVNHVTIKAIAESDFKELKDEEGVARSQFENASN